MHAFLLSGGTKETRSNTIESLLKERSVSQFDRAFLKNEDASIGVTEVREFTKKLSLSPSGTTLAGIVENAETLTIEAQNALLKTLEEPNAKTILILETANANALLPTILSRCQRISLGETQQYTSLELESVSASLQKLKAAKLGEQIKQIDAIAADRDAAKLWVDKAIAASRLQLLNDQSPKIAQFIRKLLHAQKQLNANVTPKLVLDAIFLN